MSIKNLGDRIIMIPLIHTSKEVEEYNNILKHPIKLETDGKVFIKIRTDKDGYILASLTSDRGNSKFYESWIPL